MAETAPRTSRPGIEATVPEHGRTWYLVVGGLLVVAGLVALVYPIISTLATAVVLSWLLVISGILLIAHAFGARTMSRSLWSGLIGLAWLAGGVLTFFYPVLGSLSFTIALAVVFLAQGIFELIGAWSDRTSASLGWHIASGIVAIAAGMLILAGLPSSALWALGVIVGINLLATGVSYIATSSIARPTSSS